MSEHYEYRRVPIAALKTYERNPRTHSPEQIEALRRSIREFGFTNPLLVDEKNDLIAGHGRLIAAKEEGITELPAIVVTGLSADQRRALVIADNQLALSAGWNNDLLREELQFLESAEFDMELLGFSEQELTELLNTKEDVYGESMGSGALLEKFGEPPFTVLDARTGRWHARKAQWKARGIASEEGRGENLVNYGAGARLRGVDTSIFDPVLCELLYLWFSPAGGTVLDPFAGGSVRGIVASKLGRSYIGVDLRPEQIEANRAQAEKIIQEGEPPPVWHCGDSRHIAKLAEGVQADFVMSCPPYADLERYSNDPRDLSTMKYADFLAAYREIIKGSCALLKNDRFACFVVGEIRDKKGIYRNFIGDTIAAFKDAGLGYYNEAILVTQVASNALRSSSTFPATRKLGKTHQNVLIFVKGDPKRATEACGEIEVVIPDEIMAQALAEESDDPAAKYGEVQ